MHERNKSTIALPESEPQDVLTGILRRGARKLLADAIETEVTEWIAAHATLRDAAGRRQVVRNGHLPARNITTGLGPVEVRQPRVRDRRPGADVERFSSKILPPYLRKAKSVEDIDSLALSQRHQHGRLPRGPDGAGRSGLSGSVGPDRHAAKKASGKRNTKSGTSVT